MWGKNQGFASLANAIICRLFLSSLQHKTFTHHDKDSDGHIVLAALKACLLCSVKGSWQACRFLVNCYKFYIESFYITFLNYEAVIE